MNQSLWIFYQSNIIQNVFDKLYFIILYLEISSFSQNFQKTKTFLFLNLNRIDLIFDANEHLI